MFRQTLIWMFISPLAVTAAFGQGSAVLPERIGLYQPAGSANQSATRFHLKGTLISKSGRSAMVNGRLSEEGDRIGDAQILSIEEGAVRVLVGSREFTVNVGARFVGDGPSRSAPVETPALQPRQVTPKPALVADAGPPQDPNLTPPEIAPPNHTVAWGDTLSSIAQAYGRADVTLDQMMMALFDANPEAFGGNINILYEGAVLHIPGSPVGELDRPDVATAAVNRHVERWRNGAETPTAPAQLTNEPRYGPVGSGETLSQIAQRLSVSGMTMDQMMIAMFDANPEAFGGNIHVLFEGATLRIPDWDNLRPQTPAVASAEVVRQTPLNTGT